jgi:hypothetical protein
MRFLEALRRVSKLGFYLGAGAAMTLVQACGGGTQRDADVDVDQVRDADVDQTPDADPDHVVDADPDHVVDADPDQAVDADPDTTDGDEEDDWDIPCE